MLSEKDKLIDTGKDLTKKIDFHKNTNNVQVGKKIALAALLTQVKLKNE